MVGCHDIFPLDRLRGGRAGVVVVFRSLIPRTANRRPSLPSGRLLGLSWDRVARRCGEHTLAAALPAMLGLVLGTLDADRHVVRAKVAFARESCQRTCFEPCGDWSGIITWSGVKLHGISKDGWVPLYAARFPPTCEAMLPLSICTKYIMKC